MIVLRAALYVLWLSVTVVPYAIAVLLLSIFVRGDRLYWLSTGAYTTSYSAVEFNGFPPLKSFYL